MGVMSLLAENRVMYRKLYKSFLFFNILETENMLYLWYGNRAWNQSIRTKYKNKVWDRV